MSSPRDNWARLVTAVVKREQNWQLCHAPSISTVSSDTLSDFTESILSFDDFSASLPSPVLRTDPSSFPQVILIFLEEFNEAIEGAEIFKSECAKVCEQVEHLCQMLLSVNGIAASTSPDATFYDRPFNAIATKVSGCLEKSFTLVKRCRRSNNLLRRIVTIVVTDDFKKLLSLLDSCVGDMTWVLSIYEAGGVRGGITSLPPIASDDPMIVWVWSFIASLCMGQLEDKIEAASGLASLAEGNDRYKVIIVREGGISPLVMLLEDGSSTEGQIAATSALYFLANNVERVQAIIDEIYVPSIVKLLRDSEMKVQIRVANLVAKMAENCPQAHETFASAISPLLTLLSFELLMHDSELKSEKQRIRSLFQLINKVLEKESQVMEKRSLYYSEESDKGENHRMERENEKPEVKHGLKVSCAEALWVLAKGSVLNIRRISQNNGLLCLAKLVETEEGELQYNCLMTIMEITAVAESDRDLRIATFKTKTNTTAVNAVVDQLIRLIKDCDDPRLRIAATTAIGSLARVFPARETNRVIGPLVEQLSHGNQDVAIEAAISLVKFANSENFLCVEHSKSIIEFKGVPPIMTLLRGSEKAKLHGLILICYLVIHAEKSDDLERAGVVNVFEGVDQVFVSQHPEIKELITRATILVLHKSHSSMLAQSPFFAPSI